MPNAKDGPIVISNNQMELKGKKEKHHKITWLDNEVRLVSSALGLGSGHTHKVCNSILNLLCHHELSLLVLLVYIINERLLFCEGTIMVKQGLKRIILLKGKGFKRIITLISSQLINVANGALIDKQVLEFRGTGGVSYFLCLVICSLMSTCPYCGNVIGPFIIHNDPLSTSNRDHMVLLP